MVLPNLSGLAGFYLPWPRSSRRPPPPGRPHAGLVRPRRLAVTRDRDIPHSRSHRGGRPPAPGRRVERARRLRRRAGIWSPHRHVGASGVHRHLRPRPPPGAV